MQGELARKRLTIAPPRASHQKRYHVFCSPRNAGARELIDELCAEEGLPSVALTSDAGEIGACEYILVYLTGLTWTSAEASAAFAAQIERAMDLEVLVLLAHEMPGIGGQEERHGCEFDTFFACEEGATPNRLLKRGVYDTIAIPLKGGGWRHTSLVMLAQGLSTAASASKASAESSEAARKDDEAAALAAELSGAMQGDGRRHRASSRVAPAEQAQGEGAGGGEGPNFVSEDPAIVQPEALTYQ